MRELPLILLILAVIFLLGQCLTAAPRYPQQSYYWECELVRAMHTIAENEPETFVWNDEEVSKEVFLLSIIRQWEIALENEADPIWDKQKSE